MFFLLPKILFFNSKNEITSISFNYMPVKIHKKTNLYTCLCLLTTLCKEAKINVLYFTCNNLFLRYLYCNKSKKLSLRKICENPLLYFCYFFFLFFYIFWCMIHAEGKHYIPNQKNGLFHTSVKAHFSLFWKIIFFVCL